MRERIGERGTSLLVSHSGPAAPADSACLRGNLPCSAAPAGCGGAPAGADLIRRHPYGVHDAGVQFAVGIMAGDCAGEGEAQISRVRFGRMPAINAEQMLRGKVIRRLFQHFARHRGQQRFIGFKMSGRLVETHALRGFFLNQQEFSIALDDGGDSDVGFPDHFLEPVSVGFMPGKNKKGRVAPAFFQPCAKLLGGSFVLSLLSLLSLPSLLAWLLLSCLLPWQQAWLQPSWQQLGRSSSRSGSSSSRSSSLGSVSSNSGERNSSEYSSDQYG